MSEGGDLLTQEEIDALLREVQAAAEGQELARQDASGTGSLVGVAPAETDTQEQAGASALTDAESVKTDPMDYAELGGADTMGERASIELLKDVPMEITVVLGKARMRVGDVLTLGPGSIVELDRLAGEPVDVMVNGRLIAKGEVVVIDEHFGIRIGEIVSRA